MKKFFCSSAIAVFIMSIAFCVNASAQWGPASSGNSYGVMKGNSGQSGWIRTGYRGMVEMGHGLALYNGGYAFEFTTTHGYQFTPHWYLGGIASFGCHNTYDYSIYSYMPFTFRIAADARYYVLKSRVTPFLGAQLGLDTCEGAMAYMGFAIGGRCALSERFALNISMLLSSGYWMEGELMFKVGFEF